MPSSRKTAATNAGMTSPSTMRLLNLSQFEVLTIIVPPHSSVSKARSRTGDNIPHRCRDYNILHSNRMVDNILHSNMDIHSKHVCRLDDKPGERADGRVHNSAVHSLVELVWSPSNHSTGLRS